MIKSLLLPFLIFLMNCSQEKPFLEMKNTYTFEGRVKIGKDSAEIYWPGSSVSFEVTGKYVDVFLKDNIGESEYSIIINGNEQEKVLRPSLTPEKIRIIDNEIEKVYQITLHRRNDYSKGTTTFYGVETDGKVKPTPKKEKFIEFYGNSITVGYANIDTTGEDNPLYTNNYQAFSALTARKLNAEVSCIAKSGIGVMVSWFDIIMPELYDRFDPNIPNSKWDFSRRKPNVVVINLLQNDSWLFNNPDNEFYIKRIGRVRPSDDEVINYYKEFVKSVRDKYPNIPIICMLGCMDIVQEGSVWINYVDTAVSQLNDEQIYTYQMPFLAKTAHPSSEMHKEMSELLVKFIKEKKLM